MNLSSAQRVHFIGVGGAGMSALAKVLLERGRSVSGSDIKRSRPAIVLEAMGAALAVGHHADLIDPAAPPDVVVASSAIPKSNPELVRARQLGLPVLTRGEGLAQLLAPSDAIVVAGTHGKTTTTSMVVSILRSAGIDATYLIGAGLNDVGTNARAGTAKLAVSESDESDGSFLLLQPYVALVTNVEADHLDHWGSLEDLRVGFGRFVRRTRAGGAVVVPASDDRLVAVARSTGHAVLTFGEGGDVTSGSVEPRGQPTRFVLHAAPGSTRVELQVPGLHNVSNALAAAAACLHAGVSLDAIAAGLHAYRGVERRFEVRGMARGITIIDDYAHHPTEVRVTLAAARSARDDRLVAVFQPHRYSRTSALWRDFGASFADADRIVITDVYGAGEEAVPGVTGKLVADAVCSRLPGRPVAYLPHRGELLDYLQRVLRPGDAVLTLGAGDVTAVGDELLVRLDAS